MSGPAVGAHQPFGHSLKKFEKIRVTPGDPADSVLRFTAPTAAGPFPLRARERDSRPLRSVTKKCQLRHQSLSVNFWECKHVLLVAALLSVIASSLWPAPTGVCWQRYASGRRDKNATCGRIVK